MRKYLQTLLEPQDVERILQDLLDMTEADVGIDDILDVLGEEGLQFEKKTELNVFLSLYRELNDHTRKCLNRGHTPLELRRLMAVEGQISMFGDENA